jgi:hypothetical protein
MKQILREQFFILTPEVLVNGIKSAITQFNFENPLLAMGPDDAHTFIGWGLRKAFSDLTGYSVDSFKEDPACERFYNMFRRDFEHYMFGAISDIGARKLTWDYRYNLVLTHERLYLIAY